MKSSEAPKAPYLQPYAEEEEGQVGKDLVQSRLMFAELAMVVATGLAVARL